MSDPASKALSGLAPETLALALSRLKGLESDILAPEKIEAFDREGLFPEDLIRALAAPPVALPLLFLPEDFGGLGGGVRDLCALGREMGGICLGVASAFFSLMLGLSPVLAFGTPGQRARFLPPVAEGRALWAFAATEPGAGSNPAAIQTLAEEVPGGFRLSGRKRFISTGASADFVSVLANGPGGPAFFVVEKGAQGFSAGPPDDKHGLRACQTAPLFFDGVFVPTENLVGGEPGKGLVQGLALFSRARLAVAAMALGAAEKALSLAIARAGDASRPGGPLSEKQGFTHTLVLPHLAALAAAGAFIDQTALKFDAAGPEPPELAAETAVAKLLAADAAHRAVSDALFALGGEGYARRGGVEKIKRDVAAASIYEGTSEIQKAIAGTLRWKAAVRSRGRFHREIADELDMLALGSPDVGALMLALAASAAGACFTLAHRERLVRSQAVLFTLAEMTAHAEAGAALAHAAADSRVENRPEAGRLEVLSRVFARRSASVAARGAARVALGSGRPDPETARDFLKSIHFSELCEAESGCFTDLDILARLVFAKEEA